MPFVHVDVKRDTPGKNFLQQQSKFDRFIHEFNHERPHQAHNMRYPAELYRPSPRPYTGLPELEYPLHHRTITVTQCGRLCIGRRKINLSVVFAGQNVGVREVAGRKQRPKTARPQTAHVLSMRDYLATPLVDVELDVDNPASVVDE